MSDLLRFTDYWVCILFCPKVMVSCWKGEKVMKEKKKDKLVANDKGKVASE